MPVVQRLSLEDQTHQGLLSGSPSETVSSEDVEPTSPELGLPCSQLETSLLFPLSTYLSPTPPVHVSASGMGALLPEAYFFIFFLDLRN